MGHLLEMDALQLIYVILLGYLGYRFIFRFPFPRKPPRLHSAAVLVLGDVGRSPRMMYHAESLAEHGFETYIIGNRGVFGITDSLHSGMLELAIFRLKTCTIASLNPTRSFPIPYNTIQ